MQHREQLLQPQPQLFSANSIFIPSANQKLPIASVLLHKLIDSIFHVKRVRYTLLTSIINKASELDGIRILTKNSHLSQFDPEFLNFLVTLDLSLMAGRIHESNIFLRRASRCWHQVLSNCLSVGNQQGPRFPRLM